MISGLASQGLNVAENLATQRVIGFHRTVKKVTKKKETIDDVNIGLQAWEIGIIIASIAAYDYVEGQGALASSVSTLSTKGINDPYAFHIGLP